MNSDIIVFKNSLTRKKESIKIRHRMNLKLKNSYFGSGVARLNREAGQNPARSRHCERERFDESHCARAWEGVGAR